MVGKWQIVARTKDYTKDHDPEASDAAFLERELKVMNGTKPGPEREHPTGSKHKGPGSTMRK